MLRPAKILINLSFLCEFFFIPLQLGRTICKHQPYNWDLDSGNSEVNGYFLSPMQEQNHFFLFHFLNQCYIQHEIENKKPSLIKSDNYQQYLLKSRENRAESQAKHLNLQHFPYTSLATSQYGQRFTDEEKSRRDLVHLCQGQIRSLASKHAINAIVEVINYLLYSENTVIWRTAGLKQSLLGMNLSI